MPQTGKLRPTAPYFVEYVRVKRYDKVVIKLLGGNQVDGTVRAPAVIGAVIGVGPKEWSPRMDAMRRAKPLLTAPAGAYVSITVNWKEVVMNSLVLHGALIVLRED